MGSDGRRLVTGSTWGELRLWSAPIGTDPLHASPTPANNATVANTATIGAGYGSAGYGNPNSSGATGVGAVGMGAMPPGPPLYATATATPGNANSIINSNSNFAGLLAPAPAAIDLKMAYGALPHDVVRNVAVPRCGGVVWSGGKHNAALWDAATGEWMINASEWMINANGGRSAWHGFRNWRCY